MVLRPDRQDDRARDLREMGAGFRGDRPPDRHRPDRGPPPGPGRGRHPARPAGRAGAALPPADRADRRRPRRSATWLTRSGSEPALLKLIGCPDLCSRAWIWNQYDSTIGGQTVRRPGAADAAVVRIEDHDLALALTTDCTPRYCAADPEEGGKQAVAEAWRNLTAVGARPLAITDNMNFGNPEKPEIMGQFAAAHRGHGRGLPRARLPGRERQCQPLQRDRGRAASCPRRRSAGWACWSDAAHAAGIALPPGLQLVLIGETGGWLGQSLWLREIAGREEGAPPPVDLAAERRTRRFRARRRSWRAAVARLPRRVRRRAAGRGRRDGAGRRDRRGAGRRRRTGSRRTPIWFGEDQGRYVLAVADAAPLLRTGGGGRRPGAPDRRELAAAV